MPPESQQTMSPFTSPAAPQQASAAKNPGKTLGIIGFIFGFIFFLNIPGLILSIIGLVKSKAAGFKNGLAIAGIVLNSVVLVFGFLAFITIIAYSGISNKAYNAEALSNAETVQKVAESYKVDTGLYPANVAEFNSTSNTTILPEGIDLVTDSGAVNAANGRTTVAYVPADDDSKGTIYYWSYQDSGRKKIVVGE